MKKNPSAVYTIGHSTHPLEELVGMLKSFHVKLLVDVRTIPKSKHNPQFNQDHLSTKLPKSGIAYKHMTGLGGLRHAKKDSINAGWRNVSFRGYADYMQTPEFEENLEELIHLARRKSVAIMCAEAVPWRCHRSLIADALLVRDFQVIDIMGLNKSTPHKLNSMAKVSGTRIHYPPER